MRAHHPHKPLCTIHGGFFNIDKNEIKDMVLTNQVRSGGLLNAKNK